MNSFFQNKVALITGAAFGIGRATAIEFAKHGVKLILVDLVESTETLHLVKAAGSEGISLICDVSQSEQVQSMVQKAIETYGRIDFAFNNAGIEGQSNPTDLCSDTNWQQVIAVNLTGVFLCMKHVLPVMLKQGEGAIVNNASVAGLIGFQNSPAYVASKHGVVGLTKTTALENIKKGIRVNAVCPGVIKTPMIDRFTGENKEIEKQFIAMEPIGRLGEPIEVAQTVVWLCSNEASFISGQAIPVDGAWTAQ